MMKLNLKIKFPGLFIAVILVSSISSCCKDMCIKEQLHLRFIGFDRLELDTIDMKIFDPATDFTQLLDSQQMIFGLQTMDTIPVNWSINVQLDKDIAILLPSTGRQFQLRDFQTKREPCGCSQGDRKIVTAFVLDDTPQTGT